MKKAYLILSLLLLTAFSSFAQSPSQIKLHCEYPYNSIYGVVQIVANGNIKYVPCPTKSSIFSGNVDFSGATITGLSPLTTKGDLWGFSTVNTRVPVGTNGQALIADNTDPRGVTYGIPTNAANAYNLLGGAGGSIPYQSATDSMTFLANGTAGQVLKSNGTTLAPSWATPTTGTVTSVSSADANITVANGTTTPTLTLVQAPALKSATTTVNVASATAPVSGQVLMATGASSATWQSPLPYTVYSALLSQSSTSAPTAIILQNTTGANFSFAYSSLGTYTMTSDSAILTANKTWALVSTPIGGGGVNIFSCSAARNSTTVVNLKCLWNGANSTNLTALKDDALNNTAIEVRIYP